MLYFSVTCVTRGGRSRKKKEAIWDDDVNVLRFKVLCLDAKWFSGHLLLIDGL